MTKSVGNIKDEISNFYINSQREITDVSLGSVAGGLIYGVSAGIKTVYDKLDEIERQAYISTATGRYLDLLIDGGYGLKRKSSTRSRGYVMVYADSPIINPDNVGNSLICVDYDYANDRFLSDFNRSTKFSGQNAAGSSSAIFSLIKPRNSQFYTRDRNGTIRINLRGKNAQYLILPVASLSLGTEVNLAEGALNVFNNPPTGIKYVTNVNDIASFIFNRGVISSSPIFSRNTIMSSFDSLTLTFSVINAFNFSSNGFLDISYRARFPTRILRAAYRSISGDEVSGGISLEYFNKTQTTIQLNTPKAFINRYIDNVFIRYDLNRFSYYNEDLSKEVTYTVDSSDVWRASDLVTLGDNSTIGPSSPVVGSAEFFRRFFWVNDWVLQQKREQISADLIFDPDSALTDDLIIRSNNRLSIAENSMDDISYRNYFRAYINSLSKATKPSIEFAALSVPGVSFAKVLDRKDSPVGTSVVIAASANGSLQEDKRQQIISVLKDDWVSSGVRLVVKSPDLIGIKVTVEISLTDDSLESSVRTRVEENIISYLQNKNPDDEVKYGDIYSIINSVFGVKNVSKLIIGKHNPSHYVKNPFNYHKNLLEAMVSHRSNEYYFDEDSSFYEQANDVVFSTDFNQIEFTPIQFSDYEKFLYGDKIFGYANQTLYSSIEGLYASDGGSTLNAGNSYSYSSNLYQNVHLSSDNLLKVSYVISTDASVAVQVNGVSFTVTTSSDNSLVKTAEGTLPYGTSDVTIQFNSTDTVQVLGIQAFLHDETIDAHIVSSYDNLYSLSFLDKSRIAYVYDMEIKSKRYKILKTIRPNLEVYAPRLRSLMQALVEATCIQERFSPVPSCSLNLFQTIARDFQYGSNFSGKNTQGFLSSFSDTTLTDESFKRVLIYSSTAPLTTEFESVYPLNPEKAENRYITDYKLGSTEIARIHQNLYSLNNILTPAISIKVV